MWVSPCSQRVGPDGLNGEAIGIVADQPGPGMAFGVFECATDDVPVVAAVINEHVATVGQGGETIVTWPKTRAERQEVRTGTEDFRQEAGASRSASTSAVSCPRQ